MALRRQGKAAKAGGSPGGRAKLLKSRRLEPYVYFPPACGRRWRPDLQLVEVNGARRGALPGGDARHMLLQDSLLGALAVQVIWGLYWVASRTLGTLDQR